MNESTLVPREEIGDLDWLARNVHAWPENGIIETATTEIPSKLAFDGVAFSLQQSAPISRHAKYVTKQQWLARRAELQNKPSWKDAPEWVGWLAQDKSGAWWFFRCHPEAMSEGWDSNYSAYNHSSWVDGEVLGDWRDTLEKRPEQKAFDQFVSVEDAATAKQPAPKGSGNPILGMVLADLTNRAFEGKEKYGEPLLAHNGRNPLWDAYQEALDLAMYLRQAIEEQR